MQLEFAPWRLSGTVIGPLHNDPAALAALGDAVQQPPYKAPPQAPVLYVKPRNTRVAPGQPLAAPGEGGEWQLGASLAMVIGRSACRVTEADAPECIAGWTLVADLSIPHATFYRHSVRLKARDRSCLVGSLVVPRAALDPATAVLQVAIDGHPAHEAAMGVMQRPAARLLSDVSSFMTLHPGDVLMLGLVHGAPPLRAGQGFTIACAGLGTLAGQVEQEGA